jgi:hypothetical protein
MKYKLATTILDIVVSQGRTAKLDSMSNCEKLKISCCVIDEMDDLGEKR